MHVDVEENISQPILARRLASEIPIAIAGNLTSAFWI